MDSLRVAKVERVILERTTSHEPYTRVELEGTLHLTPHHLFFSPNAPAPDLQPKEGESSVSAAEGVTASEVWVPYPTITALQRLPQAISGRYPLIVRTKTFDTYTLSFQKDREGGAEDVWQSVRDCAVAQNVEQLYAFFYTLPKSPVVATPTPAVSIPEPTIKNPLALSSSPNDSAAAPPRPETPRSGWSTFNPRTEFARQGVGSRTKAWRFTDINRDYGFCPTYPAKLVVPSRISDSVLQYAVKYRSKGRIPALTYLHWGGHASITRSSQPMVGFKNNRSQQDERLVECIFTSHTSPDNAFGASSLSSSAASLTALPSSYGASTSVYGATPTNLIIDARPTTNAMANRAKGAGTELMEYYRGSKKEHLGIDNIHVMRNSLKHVVEAIAESEATNLPVDRERLRKSGWLKHISSILEGVLIIVRNIHINSSHVLIHCSDGWDRTSQLSAAAQLCLDPYYRTYEGFKVLVEKDWLAFGHMFMQRSGHLSSTKLFTATPENFDGDEESDDDIAVAVKGVQAFFGSVSKQFQSNSHLKEISPVFHQFLDTVWQIMRQFPDRFEFNEELLLDLHYHLYACQFGTFLFDSERQRRVPVAGHKAFVERTTSAWEWFDLPAQRKRYTNTEFNPELDDRDSREPHADLGVLLLDPKDVQFWYRLFKRNDDDMNAPLSRFLAQEALAPGVEEGHDHLTAQLPTPHASPRTGNSPLRSESGSPWSGTSTPITTAPAPAPAPGTAAPFARLNSFSNKAQSSPSQGWNWSQLSTGLSTGALSAFNQIKASASDAIKQVQAREDDEMWAAGYAPGTGIGEGRAARQPSTTLPRTAVRMPSDANPWSTESPTSTAFSPGNQSSSPISANQQPDLPSVRQSSFASNPWGDGPAKTPSLSDLSLDAERKKSAKDKEEKDKAEKELLEAALGGDSKAWDPLGAL